MSTNSSAVGLSGDKPTESKPKASVAPRAEPTESSGHPEPPSAAGGAIELDGDEIDASLAFEQAMHPLITMNYPPEPASIPIKILRLTKTAKLPVKAHESDAGFDIFCDEDAIVHPRDTVRVSTGIKSVIPPGYCALIFDKSSVAESGVGRLAGVVDAGYRGEWIVVLCNHSENTFVRSAGQKIAQAVIVPVPSATIKEVDEFAKEDETPRGAGGFGSTGI